MGITFKQGHKGLKNIYGAAALLCAAAAAGTAVFYSVKGPLYGGLEGGLRGLALLNAFSAAGVFFAWLYYSFGRGGGAPGGFYNSAAAFLLALFAVNALFVQEYSLENRVVSGDEYSVYFQSDVYAEGGLYNTCIPANSALNFKRHHVVLEKDREYSKYPPGLALVMALFKKAGARRLVNLLFTLLSLALVFRAAVLLSGSRTAALMTLALCALSPSFVFNAASYFPHASVMFFLLACLLFFMKAESAGEKYFTACGAVLGALVFFRPFDAAAAGAALAVFFVADVIINRRSRREAASGLLRGLAGLLPFVILFLAYQKIYTGSYFKSPYEVYLPYHVFEQGMGLKEISFSPAHYFAGGLGRLTPLWFRQMFDWSNSFLIPAALIWPFVPGAFSRRFTPLVLLFPLVFVFAYALHPGTGGDSYGARYYFPVLWCYFFMTAMVFYRAALAAPRFLRPAVPLLFMAGLIAFNFTALPGRGLELKSVLDDRFRLYSEVENSIGPEPALVLIKSVRFMDNQYYVRNRPGADDRIIYGVFVKGADNYANISADFPGRKIWVYDYRSLRKIFPLLPEADG